MLETLLISDWWQENITSGWNGNIKKVGKGRYSHAERLRSWYTTWMANWTPIGYMSHFVLQNRLSAST